MTIWYFPIEPIEERYSAQWLRWFGKHFPRDGADVCVINPAYHGDKLNDAQWLSPADTVAYKARQLAAFTRYVKGDLEVGRKVHPGDVVLFADGWNPEITQVAYMRSMLGLDVRLVGMLHAGTWDPYDATTASGMRSWAVGLEKSMLQSLDAICVATDFHAQLISEYFRSHGQDFKRIYVTGLPLYPGEFIDHWKPWADRERLVVFPHRLAGEKQPGRFREIEQAYRTTTGDTITRFVFSRDVCESKEDYYALLGRARAVVSTALQETWGIAMIEGATLGAYPVCPTRLSYPEVHGPKHCYRTVEEAVLMIQKAVHATRPHEHSRADAWRSAWARIRKVCDDVAKY